MFNNQAQGGLKGILRWVSSFSDLSPLKKALVLSPFAVIISFAIAKFGILAAGGLLVVIVGLPLLYFIVGYPKVGIAALIIASFFLNYASEFLPEETPLGIVMDALTYLLIFGFLVKQKFERNWDYFKDPISYLILAWLAYNFIEAINPVSPSILAWVYTVRTVAFIMLMYFIFVYSIRDIKYIRFLFKLWLFLCLLASISGIQQELIGLFPYEKTWYYADPSRMKFFFVAGHLRKVSIFPDPVTFSYNMVVAVVLCLCFIPLKIALWKKIAMIVLIPMAILGMLYSGTRGAYVLLPAAMAMVVVLNFNKKLLLFVLVAGSMLAVVIVMPTSNPLVKRFQSAFKPSDDASFNVRAENQKRIKPYILSHPIGGGLGSVGVWGRKFAPNSFLASFPPDSGYVRVAVEMGYVGLLLFSALMFIILLRGINNYYLIKNPELKRYCLAMILVIFVFNIGNYPQQALVQYPSNILFYLAAALLNVTLRLDQQEQREIEQKNLDRLTVH